MTTVNEGSKVVFWHRELPPLDAELAGEHTVEAVSGRVRDQGGRRDELWSRCRDELMARASERIREEISRLGGRYAHVLDEAIDPRHDASTGEAWLHGRFTYVLYR
jgi:hypothetical protein